ncbi:MAG: sulfite exporter TauE/SafE family protein [Candidatus Omnitrophota bacterium]
MNKHFILNMFLTGLLFGSGPCLASCGPILVTYIAGTKKNIAKAVISYVLFSLSRILVYLVLSLAIFFIGALSVEKISLNYSGLVYKIGGGFIVLIGLFMVLGKRIGYPHFLNSLSKGLLEKDKKSVCLLGLIVGLLPCAPLLAVFSYIALAAKSTLESLVYGLSFGIGTILSPLILLVIASGALSGFIRKKEEVYRRVFSLACGLIIIFLGLQLILRGING